MTPPDKIHILGKRLEIFQPPDGFRSGTDAVMLAAACCAADGQSVLDMGCGVGTAGLCLLSRVSGADLTGIDIQDDHVDLASQNAALNNFQARFIVADIYDYEDAPFDHVICNPPYLEEGKFVPSPTTSIALAKGEANLQDWVNAAYRNLKPRGCFTLVHRADHIDQILQAMGTRFGGVEIIPLWPKEKKESRRIIIRAVKNSKSPAKIHSGLILHEENGDYTIAAENILRHAYALL